MVDIFNIFNMLKVFRLHLIKINTTSKNSNLSIFSTGVIHLSTKLKNMHFVPRLDSTEESTHSKNISISRERSLKTLSKHARPCCTIYVYIVWAFTILLKYVRFFYSVYCVVLLLCWHAVPTLKQQVVEKFKSMKFLL